MAAAAAAAAAAAVHAFHTKRAIEDDRANRIKHRRQFVDYELDPSNAISFETE